MYITMANTNATTILSIIITIYGLAILTGETQWTHSNIPSKEQITTTSYHNIINTNSLSNLKSSSKYHFQKNNRDTFLTTAGKRRIILKKNLLEKRCKHSPIFKDSIFCKKGLTILQKYKRNNFPFMTKSLPYENGHDILRKNSMTLRYLRYSEIEDTLYEMKKQFPNMVTVESIGYTSENRRTLMIKISEPKHENHCEENNYKRLTSEKSSPKPVILIEAGLHAREWISPAATINVATWLLRNWTSHEGIRKNLQSYDWYIIPVSNPDGYVYSHEKNRMWRKNRNPENNRACPGVDLNRNFDVSWGEAGSSNNTCDQTYHGPHAFSEPETRNLRNLAHRLKDQLGTLDGKSRRGMFLSVHSFGELFLYPWGHTSEKIKEHSDVHDVARNVVATLWKKHRRKYKYGNVHDTIYVVNGGACCWFRKLGVKYTYSIELYPNRKGITNKWQVMPQKISAISHHLLDAILAASDTIRCNVILFM